MNQTVNGKIKLYYHQDYLGTADYLTSDLTGKITSWTMYNEWGDITHNAVLKCGQRELDLVKNYTGHEYDQVLEMYYAKNRMYNPNNRRFTQIDPVRDSLNWYAYVGNNPVNRWDPLGLFEQGDRLELGDGMKLGSKYTAEAMDVFNAQLRLLALGYFGEAGIGDIKFGYFDQTTLNAVNWFKQDQGLGNASKQEKGVIGDQTWRTLSLPYDGVMITMPGGSQEMQKGRAYAVIELEDIINKKQDSLLKQDKTILTTWNYGDFTYERSYYFKQQCSDDSIAGTLEFAAFLMNYMEAYEITSSSGYAGPWGAAYAAALAFETYYSPEGYPSASGNMMTTARYLREQAQAKAQTNYEIVKASPLKYTIDYNRTRSGYNHLKSGYISQLAKLSQDVADQYGNSIWNDMGSEGASAMKYVLTVAQLNASEGFKGYWLDQFELR